MSHIKNINNIFLPMISDTLIFILYPILISQISSKSFLKPTALVYSPKGSWFMVSTQYFKRRYGTFPTLESILVLNFANKLKILFRIIYSESDGIRQAIFAEKHQQNNATFKWS